MPSSVKIRDETKSKLEILQAKILLESGVKLSQQELIDKLVDFGSENQEEMIAPKFVTSSAIDDILALSSSWKIKTEPDMLDDILLGE